MELSAKNQFNIIFLIVYISIGAAHARTESIEHDLIANLTSEGHYDVNARPVSSADEAVVVDIDVGLQQIIDLDEPTQILSTDIFLRLYWKDVSLTWNPQDYGNVTSLRIYTERIWRPDITLYNDVSTERREAEKLYPAQVTFDGNVSWLSPVIFFSSCQLDMTYFPWDKQDCRLELGSWTYDSSKLKIRNSRPSADISVFMENGEYELDSVPVELEIKHYPCCTIPYELLIYTVKVVRKPMFYIFNLILPCVFISFVGLFVFILPPNSGEKVSLSVTVLLASTVFLMIVAEAVPPQSSTVPLVSRYFEAVIFTLACVAIVTVFEINIHHRGEYFGRPPKFIRVFFFEWLATILFMRGVVKRNTDYTGHSVRKISIKVNKSELHANQNEYISGKMASLPRTDDMSNGGVDLCDRSPTLSNQLLYEILLQLRKKEETSGSDSNDVTTSRSVREWEVVAMVLDRVFLTCFFIASTLTTTTILLGRK